MLVFVIFACLAGVALLSFYLFDCVVRYQHQHFHQDWLDSGSPIGFFWVPGDSKKLLGLLPSGSSARARAYYKWAVVRPAWVDRHVVARKHYRRFRIAVWGALFGMLIWGGVVLSRSFAG
jgi:hypothetical protein